MARMSTHNEAPAWETVSGHPIVGMAAHPSMQRKSTNELFERLLLTRKRRDSVLREFGPSDERHELIASYDETIAAHVMALKWRGVDA
jgi:hypothetical protein